jgi:hypothetical protein
VIENQLIEKIHHSIEGITITPLLPSKRSKKVVNFLPLILATPKARQPSQGEQRGGGQERTAGLSNLHRGEVTAWP